MYQDEKMYDANGSKVSSDYTIHSSQGAMTINGIRYEIGDQPFQRVLSNVNDVLVVRTYNYASYPSRTAVDEYIYYQIGADGNLISEFAIYQQWTPENLPCNLAQGDAVCKWYTGQSVQIGKHCFTGVLSAYNFVGADNQIYALIIYPDRAELYRINPGYSDVTPIDFDKMGDPAESPETWGEVFGVNTFSVSERTVAETAAATATTITHIDFSPYEVQARAEAMAELTWSVVSKSTVTKTTPIGKRFAPFSPRGLQPNRFKTACSRLTMRSTKTAAGCLSRTGMQSYLNNQTRQTDIPFVGFLFKKVHELYKNDAIFNAIANKLYKNAWRILETLPIDSTCVFLLY